MWTEGWRERTWSALDHPWDLIVIGGGITGAGILREATQLGLSTLLVEARDFASGTSSRSSKLVHGGFRYLKNGQFRLTYQSVRERDRLVREGSELVRPLSFIMPSYPHERLPPWTVGLGLSIFDLLAFKWKHERCQPERLCELCPGLNPAGLRGGYQYFDAQTDDARLVLRVLSEAVAAGGMALNYAPVRELLRKQNGRVRGVVIEDATRPEAGRSLEVQASMVINATGAWAEELRSEHESRLRKLRGSHLVFPFERLPLPCGLGFWHPRDRRAVFTFPWEGVVILGTTDVDHNQPLALEPVISGIETEYLIEAIQFICPELQLGLPDVQATFAGVRPVVDTGKADPSKESREHVIWLDDGLLTITGGKLTTFRLMAQAVLNKALPYLPGCYRSKSSSRILDLIDSEQLEHPDLNAAQSLRLLGRYGRQAGELVQTALPGELRASDDFPASWAEIRWEARTGGIVHLDDLLLRRVRLGILLPHGGVDLLDRVKTIVQAELNWDEARWQSEAIDYRRLWLEKYSPNAFEWFNGSER